MFDEYIAHVVVAERAAGAGDDSRAGRDQVAPVHRAEGQPKLKGSFEDEEGLRFEVVHVVV